MLKTVFLYAGQGSQRAGMGKDIYGNFPEYREVIDSVVEPDVKQLMHEGDLAELSLTENTQPCMAAFAAGVTAVLRANGIRPDAACGLSLGEYGALHVAGVMDAKDYIAVTAYRGKVMAEAAKGHDCSMSAIMGTPADVIEEVCAACQDMGMVNLVNYNCPGQYVICGDEAAVQAAEELLKEKGTKRCIRLNVSGPFHTKYMEPASEKLGEKLQKMNFNEPQIPVLLNVTGDFYREGQDLKELLQQQVKSGIHFEESIGKLLEEGVEHFIEIGPGSTLSGFVKKKAKVMGREVSIVTIDTAEQLEQVLANKEEYIHG